MDVLSGSITTLNISLHQTSHELHHPKNHRSAPVTLTSSTSKPKSSKVSNKSTTFATHSFVPPFISSSHAALAPKQSSRPGFNQRASTGYAVALLDVARCNVVVLEAVQRDVRRLSKWLGNEQLHGIITSRCVEKKEKGGILKEIMKKGKFHKHLVKLVNFLVEKNVVEMVGEMLMEFGRIYDELIAW